jgi:hypothetical protein
MLDPGIPRRTLAALAVTMPFACARAAKPVGPLPASSGLAPVLGVSPPPADASAPIPAWPESIAQALAIHGLPHVEPVALPRDDHGTERWLAFVGTTDMALAAWRVRRSGEGTVTVEPVARWPVGVRVVGASVDQGIAYVLLETLAVLDQPAGLRGVWIDAPGRASPFEASPLALGDVATLDDLASRLAHPPPQAPADGGSGDLQAALLAASASPEALSRSIPDDGVDLEVSWQGLFRQKTGKLGKNDAVAVPARPAASADAQGRSATDRLLSILREALGTHACGPDACEAFSDRGRSVVRFVSQSGHWFVKAVVEDAPAAHSKSGTEPARLVEVSADTAGTTELLRARVRDVGRVLGQAPLDANGGTIGVALTDSVPDAPLVVVREGAASRFIALETGSVPAPANDASWESAFADVDGDGRTDVVIRSATTRADGPPLSWTQVFLAPQPSVQATSMEADLASSLSTMDAPDAKAGASAAVGIPSRAVAHADACRLLAAAGTPAGFRRVTSPDAKLLLFQEPGRPTWRPKVVMPAKVAADQVRVFAAHCGELVCDEARPYCSSTATADSQHVWFGWRAGKLEIVGAADYDGE